MKLTPPALFSATKSDFTESATSFKLFKVREGPDFIWGFTLRASSNSFRGIPLERGEAGGGAAPRFSSCPPQLNHHLSIQSQWVSRGGSGGGATHGWEKHAFCIQRAEHEWIKTLGLIYDPEMIIRCSGASWWFCTVRKSHQSSHSNFTSCKSAAPTEEAIKASAPQLQHFTQVGIYKTPKRHQDGFSNWLTSDWLFCLGILLTLRNHVWIFHVLIEPEGHFQVKGGRRTVDRGI